MKDTERPRLSEWSGWAVAAVAMAACLWMARTPRPPDEVRARRFVLVSEDGRVRATLGAAVDGSAALVLADAAGTPRAALALATDGAPRLSLATQQGRPLAELGAWDDAARFALSTPQGEDFFEVGLQVDGSSRLTLADDRGPRVKLEVSPQGSPSFELSEPGHQGRAELAVEAAMPSLVLQDARGDVFRAPFPP